MYVRLDVYDPLVKKWTTISASGEEIVHTRSTPQTRAQAMYHENFGIVDQGNRDRQGQVSIADV